jgi:ATP-dependent RNA helicase DeaD
VLHGDMGQNERDHAMRKFKEKKVNLMVCTDVAARGIDVTNLTHVFNFGLPQDNESYVHRIGRTGRAGLKGKAYLIIGAKSRFAIKRLEKHMNSTIEYAHLPKVKEIKRKIVEKELNAASQILEAIREKGDGFKLDDAYELFEERFKKLKKDELMKLMFTWKFNKTLRHYNNLSDIEGSPKEGGRTSKSSERSYNRNQKRNERRKKGRSQASGRKRQPTRRRR